MLRRLGFATVGFVGAYVAGAALFLAIIGATEFSAKDPDVARWALVPIGFGWLFIGACVGRWWVLAMPLAAYIGYSLTGDEISYGPDGLTLEHLLVLALACLAAGVAVSGNGRR